MAGKKGQTPLLQAAKKREEGVVKILLGRDDVDPNKAREDGRTPASWAAENKDDEIAKLLSDRADFASRSGASLQPVEPCSPELSELSEPPSKKNRQVLTPNDNAYLTYPPSPPSQ